MRSLRKKVTLTDIWKKYPYKKRKGEILKSEGANHFPKNEINDNHKFSVDSKEFKSIVDAICKERVELLLQGKRVKLPLRSGFLELRKYRPNKRKPINWKETNKIYGEHNKNALKGQKKFIYHKNYHSQGYKPIFKWDKKTCVMKNKHIFKVRFTRNVNRYIAKNLIEDTSLISNLNSL